MSIFTCRIYLILFSFYDEFNVNLKSREVENDNNLRFFLNINNSKNNYNVAVIEQ